MVIRTGILGRIFIGATLALVASPQLPAVEENDFYRLVTVTQAKSPTASRSKRWRPSEGLVLEASGLAALPDGRLAVAIRKGEVWLVEGAYDESPAGVQWTRFAKGLHEPLGLIYHGGSLCVIQRSELTRLVDTDGDDAADEYLAIGKGWGVTGNYHEYAYGPLVDDDGNFLVTLNSTLGNKLTPDDRWRGWGLKITPQGELIPISGGMRSPCGLGTNLAGDHFFTDQQGNWVATGSVQHLRPGVFYGHPAGLTSAKLPGSTLPELGPVPSGLAWPKALREIPRLSAPAVWLPYKKMGQSGTDIACDTTTGRFGPFAGQLFVGEFRLAAVNRVFVEQVNGAYQGACFPFRQGFSCGVLSLTFGHDGSLFAGMTNRGWSTIGSASYGLQRLVWTGRIPFEILEMRARPHGFALTFTKPVDKATASNVMSYTVESFTYLLHQNYGSDEIDKRTLAVTSAQVSSDQLTVELTIDGLREGYVHELHASGVRSTKKEPLLHADAYYTLNNIP